MKNWFDNKNKNQQAFFSTDYDYYIAVGVNPNLKGAVGHIYNAVSGHFYLMLCAAPKSKRKIPLRIVSSIGGTTISDDNRRLIIRNESVMKSQHSGEPHSVYVDLFPADPQQVNRFIHFADFLIEEQKAHQLARQLSYDEFIPLQGGEEPYRNNRKLPIYLEKLPPQAAKGRYILLKEVNYEKSQSMFGIVNEEVSAYHYEIYDGDQLLASGEKTDANIVDIIHPPTSDSHQFSGESAANIRKQIVADLKAENKISMTATYINNQYLKMSSLAFGSVLDIDGIDYRHSPSEVELEHKDRLQADLLKSVPIFAEHSLFNGDTCRSLIDPFLKAVYGEPYSEKARCTQSYYYSQPHMQQKSVVSNGQLHLLPADFPTVTMEAIEGVISFEIIDANGYNIPVNWYLTSKDGSKEAITQDNYPALWGYLTKMDNEAIEVIKENNYRGKFKLTAPRKKIVEKLISVDRARMNVNDYIVLKPATYRNYIASRTKKCGDKIAAFKPLVDLQNYRGKFKQYKKSLLDLLDLASDYYLQRSMQAKSGEKLTSCEAYQMKYQFARQLSAIVANTDSYSEMERRVGSIQHLYTQNSGKAYNHPKMLDRIVALVRKLADVERQLIVCQQNSNRAQIDNLVKACNDNHKKRVLNAIRMKMVDSNWRIAPSMNTFLQRVKVYRSIKGIGRALKKGGLMIVGCFFSSSNMAEQQDAASLLYNQQPRQQLSTTKIQKRQTEAQIRNGWHYKTDQNGTMFPLNLSPASQHRVGGIGRAVNAM